MQIWNALRVFCLFCSCVLAGGYLVGDAESQMGTPVERCFDTLFSDERLEDAWL